MAAETSSLSTHVLDTSVGKPASGMPIKLYTWNVTERSVIAEAETNDDGRISEPFPKLQCGTYTIRFETALYFAKHDVESYFYPFVEVTFKVSKAGQHYHVPLLISPFGYSTYRGS